MILYTPLPRSRHITAQMGKVKIMSAYLVEDEHVKQLAAYLCNDDQSSLNHLAEWHGCGFKGDGLPVERDKLATHYANVLLRENYRSLRARYDDAEIPHRVKVTLGEVTRSSLIPAVNVLHSLACFEYQACESDDWESTDAYKLCEEIKRKAIRRLPGYDDAPWGAPFKFKQPAAEVISLSSMM